MRPLAANIARPLERAWTGWRPAGGAHGNVGRPFDLSLPVQRHWGAKVAFYLYLGGTGAGFVAAEVIFRWRGDLDARTAAIGMWSGLALAVLSALAIFDHLGPVSRWSAYFAFRRIRTSWISRGVTMLFLLLVFRLLLALPSLPGAEGLPWAEGAVAGNALRVAVLVLAFAFMAYTGLVISSWNAIAFWNTPLVPVLFMCASLLGGVAALSAMAYIADGVTGMQRIDAVVSPATLALLIVAAALLALYLQGMATATRPARVAIDMLVHGAVRTRFLGGVVVVGLLLPMAVIAAHVAGAFTIGDMAWLVLAAVVAIQIGGYYLRESVLRAGVYGPPV